jgi:hypothetical protein
MSNKDPVFSRPKVLAFQNGEIDKTNGFTLKNDEDNVILELLSGYSRLVCDATAANRYIMMHRYRLIDGTWYDFEKYTTPYTTASVTNLFNFAPSELMVIYTGLHGAPSWPPDLNVLPMPKRIYAREQLHIEPSNIQSGDVWTMFLTYREIHTRS